MTMPFDAPTATIFTADSAQNTGGATVQFTDAAAAHKNVMDADAAFRLFDRYAAMETMSWGNLKTGCFARVHLICRELIDSGVTPKKIWAFETIDGAYKLDVKYSDKIQQSWDYHVALALPVRLESGDVETVVFDPSIFNGPVTRREWADAMRATVMQTEVVPWGVAPNGYPGDYNKHNVTTDACDAHAKDVLTGISQHQIDVPRKNSEFRFPTAPVGRNIYRNKFG